MQSLDEIVTQLTALLDAYKKYTNLLTPGIQSSGNDSQTIQTSSSPTSSQTTRSSTVFGRQTSTSGTTQTNSTPGLTMPGRPSSSNNFMPGLSDLDRGAAMQLRYRPDLAVPERFQHLMGYQGQALTASGQASNFANQMQMTSPQMQNLLKSTTPALFSFTPQTAEDQRAFILRNATRIGAPGSDAYNSYLSQPDFSLEELKKTFPSKGDIVINQTNPNLKYDQAGGAAGSSDYLVQGPAVGTESKYNDPAYNTPPHNLVQRGEIKEIDGKLVIPSDRILTYFNGRKDYNMWNYGEVLRGLSPRGQDLFKLAIMDTQMPHLSKLGGVLNDSVELQQMRDVLAMRLKTADHLPQISERFNLNIPAGSYPIFTHGKSGFDSGYEEYMPDSIRDGGPLAWENGQQSRTNSTSLYMQFHQSWPQFMVGYVGPDGVEHRFEDGGAVMLDKKGNLTKLSQEEYAVAHGAALHLQPGSTSGLSNYDFGVWHIEPNVPIDSGPAGAGNPSIITYPADFDVKRLHAANEYLNGTLNLPLGTIALFKPGSRDTLIGYLNKAGQVLFDQPVTLQVEPALTSAQLEEARKAMLNPANRDANLAQL